MVNHILRKMSLRCRSLQGCRRKNPSFATGTAHSVGRRGKMKIFSIYFLLFSMFVFPYSRLRIPTLMRWWQSRRCPTVGSKQMRWGEWRQLCIQELWRCEQCNELQLCFDPSRTAFNAPFHGNRGGLQRENEFMQIVTNSSVGGSEWGFRMPGWGLFQK